MRFKTNKITASVATHIVKKMFLDGWTDEEVARFITLWHQSDRTSTLMGWLARPEDDLDRKLDAFLRPFLLTSE